jgi:flagellar basal body-associated protein FliL
MRGLIPVVVSVIVTVAMLAAAWQLKLLPLTTTAAAGTVHASADHALLSYALPERIVNLADSPGYRYLKIQVTLEFEDPTHRAGDLKGDALKQREDEFAKEIDPFSPAIQDFLITTLTRKTAAELLSPEGKDQLRQQLLDGLRQRLPGNPPRAVYFTQFVIQ